MADEKRIGREQACTFCFGRKRSKLESVLAFEQVSVCSGGLKEVVGYTDVISDV